VPSPGDDSALTTPESVVLDGANGVSLEPRQHFPQGPLSLAFGALTLVVVLLVFRLKRSRGAVAGLLLGTALPGLWLVVATRADAPLRRVAMTAPLRSSLAEVMSKVPWPRTPVTVLAEEDDVLFPLVRYALPTRPRLDAGALELEVRGHSLPLRCQAVVEQRLRCESGP
jgi:hypothetical protein